jgi:hypothetical protein
MITRTWLRNLFASRTLRNAPGTFRPALEALEERALPSVNFYPAVNTGLSNGKGPSAEALGNVYGDGTLDLVTTDVNSDTYSILKYAGNGTFSTDASNADGGSGVSSVALGDFNGDGKPDLVLANSGSNNISVLVNNGNFLFPYANAVTYGTGSYPVSVAVGDFTGNGKLDLAVACLGDATGSGAGLSVLLGNGDGTFQNAVNYAVGSGPRSVKVADFDGRHYANGKPILDLAVASEYSNSVSVLMNNGDGTFQNAVNHVVGSYPVSLAVGDFNGDGKLDLVTANAAGNNVSVLLSNGNGTFQNAVNYIVEGEPISLAVGDFSGDGKLDLVTANFASNNVSVLQGNGDGTFQNAVYYAVGTGPESVAVADLNGDDKSDLIVANQVSNNISVLLNYIPQPAAVTSAASATFTESFACQFTVQASGAPQPALSKSLTDVVPAGIAFNPATGVLSGTPAAGSAGTYTLHFSADNGVGDIATQTFTLTVYSQAASDKFVQALYTDELGRTGSAAELGSWVNVLDGSGGQAAVVAGISNSTEARDRTVTGWFQTYLGRAPSATDLSAYVTALATQTQEQVLRTIVGSTESFNDAQNMSFGGTANQNYVEALYKDLLGRIPSATELASQVAALQQVGQQALALGILQSTEYRDDVVEGYYTSLLHRTGSAAEIAYWVNTGLDVHTIRMDIEDSAEFLTNG